MFKQLGRFGVLAVCLFALAMVGCGPDDPPPVEEEPIKYVSADPVAGSTIQNDAIITVTFDGTPEGLEVTGGTATLSDKTVSIAGPFDAGSLKLALKWEGDAVVLSYTVAAPLPEEEEESTEIFYPPAAFVSATPPAGSEVAANGTISVIFDNAPSGVEVTAGTLTVDGKTAIITGPFTPGPLALTIAWADGIHTLNYVVEVPAVAFVKADPPDGSTIATDATIVLTFDGPDVDISVSAGIPFVEGNVVFIEGPFNHGPLALHFVWSDFERRESLNYIVIDITPPRVIGGAVWDGDKDVDPEAINDFGLIDIQFSEEVIGWIALETEGGDDVGWLGEVDGTIGTLELVKGKEIGNETTYVIVGKVSDAAGNGLAFRLTFTTKGRE